MNYLSGEKVMVGDVVRATAIHGTAEATVVAVLVPGTAEARSWNAPEGGIMVDSVATGRILWAAADEDLRFVSRGPDTAHVSVLEALNMGPPPVGNLAVPVFARGAVTVEMYAPKEIDPQTPHERDELYVVARGRAVFFDGSVRTQVETGALLFVAAGRPHRFEDFSADFATWVFFFGPPVVSL